MNNSSSKKRRVPWKRRASILSAMTSLAFLTIPSIAAAQQDKRTAGDIADLLQGQLGNFGRLIVGGAFIIGIGLVVAGLLKLKAAAETQGQQVKWGDGIWRIVVGVGLVSLLYFTGVGAATFGFETNATLTGGGISLGGGEGGN